MDIQTIDDNYRLFKIDNIDKFNELDLSVVFITNYKYGIVGDFIATKEKGNWYIIHSDGYIPNEEYFFSIFKKAQLL